MVFFRNMILITYIGYNLEIKIKLSALDNKFLAERSSTKIGESKECIVVISSFNVCTGLARVISKHESQPATSCAMSRDSAAFRSLCLRECLKA